MDNGNFFGAPVFTEGRDRQRKSRGGRTCHYRTKPCRFYQDTGRCAKGDRCNFVHDIRPLYTTTETETESSVGALDSGSEADTAGSEQHEWQSQSEERPRDSGKGERGNYYPITWRVIGGGVMMSGPREICQDYMAGCCHEGVDCKFSHPAAADELEPVLISELLPHQYHGSSMLPASPLQLMPVPFFMQAPPRRHPRRNVPCGQDGNVAKTRRKEEVALSGATLRPIEPSQSAHVEADSSMEAPMSPVKSARPSGLLEARMIERPLSTPPATSAVTKLIRIFPAESPQ
ncbi:hypothetical protein BC629DRAFT_1505973 [Irpex lacteus]|nr:hypothetical protein BC629DRAFT_1505973 [Irpex lacteus]